MKLLAVSLVAAASAATNYTAVYGVHPPGLGAGVFSGLSNMQQCLFALVLDAKRHPGGGAAISLRSLRWRGSWSKAESGSRFIPHEEIWRLDRWSSKLPPLVDAPRTIVDGRKFRAEPLFRTVWKSTRVSGARQFFTKSPRGDGAAVLARSSGEEPASPRHRAGVASMAWRTTRRFSTNAP